MADANDENQQHLVLDAVDHAPVPDPEATNSWFVDERG